MPACIGPLEVRNEGSTLGPAAAMDFVGTGVTATFLDGIVTVSISGGGGGTSYTEVANYAALPAAASHAGEIYVCLAGQGVYLINRKPAGFYSSDGASWNYLADLPDSYFDDSILTISDDSDSTKKVKFQLSGISTLTTRTLSVQDKSYTLEETGHASKHKSGGSDAIKLDELAAPDDTTTRDATSSLHGLMPKADKAKLDKVYVHGADVASASTINLDSATGDLIDVTGTTSITAITLAEGMHRTVRFTGILTLTHGASLVLPTSANITTAAGDFAIFRGYASSVVRCVLYSPIGALPINRGGTQITAAPLETLWIPASAMISRTTNGPSSGFVEMTTNKEMIASLDFDTGTSEYAQFVIAMPKSWDLGTVTAEFVWTAASGSGTAIFGLQGIALSNDDAIDTAFGTAQTASDTFLAANDVHVSPATAAITIGGTPAQSDAVWFQVYRDVSDTLGVDAKLIGVRLFLQLNAYTDA